MAEYINRERLKEAFNTDITNTMQTWDTSLVDLLMIEINEAPAADVVPVVHGRWIPYDDNSSWICSECKAENCYAYDNNIKRFTDKYCPNCGASMDLEE